jgi:hypothetical protein
MNLAAAYMFGRKQGVNLLQELKNACRLYFTLDNTSRNGLVVTPEKGAGTISSIASNVSTGLINEGVLMNATNKILLGNSTMNANNSLINNTDVFSFSYYREITNSSNIKTSFDLAKAGSSNANYSQYIFSNNLDFGVISREFNGATNDYKIFRYNISNSYNSTGFNHICGFFNPSNNQSKLFINAVEITNKTLLLKNAGVNLQIKGLSEVRIGCLLSENNAYMINDKIDEVSFFYGIETTQEIADFLYNNGNGLQLF